MTGLDRLRVTFPLASSTTWLAVITYVPSALRQPTKPVPSPASVSTVKTLRKTRFARGAIPASRCLTDRSALPTRDERDAL